MKETLVSIIMPAYNCGDVIVESINSVLAQTYTNWELLIVDDCSSDNTAEVVASFKDPRIHYQRNEQNSGAAVTRNTALRLAKGKYIAFLDSDDMWLPEKLKKQIAFMEQNNIVMSYTPYYILTSGNKQNIRSCPDSLNYYELTRWNRIGCLTVIYDREQVGLIQLPDLKKRNDYAMWLIILRKGYTAYKFNEPLAIYRSHYGLTQGNLSSLTKYHFQMFHFVLKYNLVVALLLTMRNCVFYSIYRIIDND